MVNVSGVMSIVLGKKTTMKITIFNSYSLKINIRKHKLFYVIQFGGGEFINFNTIYDYVIFFDVPNFQERTILFP